VTEKVGTKIERLTQLIMKGARGKASVTGMGFLPSHLTIFSYFPLNKILKVAGQSQNRSEMDLMKTKGVVDGFSYFSLIFSYFIIYSKSSMTLSFL
jgi:hypothetical protein